MTGMTKDELLAELKACQSLPPYGPRHREADRLLLAYIGDEDVTEAFEAIEKWYA